MNNIPHQRNETDGYITIKGTSRILNKMRNMILGAKERVYLAVSEEILKSLVPEITNAIDRVVKVVLITNVPLRLEGATVYFAEKSQQQIRLIVDSTNVLTGDLNDGEYSTCLYSKKKKLVDLLKESLKNEIKLIEMERNQ